MITVLANPAFANKDANPYNWMLYSSLQRQGIRVLEFTPANVLMKRWNVFHFHWPEAPFSNPRKFRGHAERTLFRVALRRSRQLNAKLVWTVHNVLPHRCEVQARYRHMMRRLYPSVDAIVVMNSSTVCELEREPFASNFPSTLRKTRYIPHPTYDFLRDYMEAIHAPTFDETPSRVLVPGSIAPYKGMERVANLARLNSQIRFRIVGRVLDASYAEYLETLFQCHENIEFVPGHVDENKLVAEVAAARCVLLPYRSIHNSGSGVLAVTMGRPVLLPSSPALHELQRYLPHGYVRVLPDSDSEAVATLQEMTALARVGAETLAALHEQFRPEAVARRHVELYAELLNSRVP